VIISLAISYVFAMTLVPALAGLFLKGREPGFGRGVWRDGVSFPKLTARFERSLDWSLANPRRSMLLVSALPLLGVLGALTLPQQFFPPADRDQCHSELRLPQQSSIEETREAASRVEEVLRAHDEVQSVAWFIGRSAPPFYYNLKQDQDGNPSYAQGQVKLASVGAVERLLPVLQRELDDAVPNAQVLTRELLQGPPVDAPIEFRIYGPNLDTLRALGLELRERISRVPTVVHSLTTLTATSPKIWLRADEEQTRLAGLDLVQIANQLNSRLEGVPGGSILEDNEEVPVRVRVADRARSVLDEIGSTSLLSPAVQAQGATGFPGIPLESLVDVELRPSLDGVPHRNGRRVNIVRGYTEAGVFPDEAFRALAQVLEEDPILVPPGYRLETGGDAAERSDAMGNLFAYVPVLVLLMIAIVSLSLGSFRLGATVFIVALQSMGLGLLSVALFRFPLGFQALIGLVGLVGVAINAAIIINAALREDPAAVRGDALAVRRVVVGETSRHIVSTTITTFGGFLPLMLSAGGFWPPFATGIAGGVVLSTVVSFYFVPAAFLLITRRHPVVEFDSEPRDRARDLVLEPAE
ncbi:MAG: efflux RND transporter permease subunit, partial [Polyangiales bacterium]